MKKTKNIAILDIENKYYAKVFINKIMIMLIIISLFILNIPVLADETPVKKNIVSSWALSSFYDAETMGLLPDEWTLHLNDYTKNISSERANKLLTLAISKLASTGLDKVNDIVITRLDGEVSRGKFIGQVYSILTAYVPDKNNDKITYLREKHIIQGDGNGLALENLCTEQEALIILMRSVHYVYTKNDLGAKGFAWTIKNNGNTVYLLGSIHIANADVHPFNQKLIKEFGKADQLVLELDLIKFMQNQAKLMSAYAYRDGTTLESQIGKENYQEAKVFLESIGTSIEPFKNYKPWAFNIVLQQIKESLNNSKENNLKINAKYGIDMWFNTNAYFMKKPIVELETPAEQVAVFDSQKLDDQIYALEQTLKKVKNKNESTEMMDNVSDVLKTWKNGDKDNFLKVYDTKEIEGTEFGKNLFEKRDKILTDKIETMLKEEGENTYFVVVGSGHCFSSTNILKTLEEKGYVINDFY